jgi:PAS domain-containing protein
MNSVPADPAIVLSTLNARYFHSALGLRYLLANMGDLQPATRLQEFIITQPPLEIVESLLRHRPRIIGLGVYIWNVTETTQVVALLKQVRPDIVIVLGGPEVSHEWETQTVVQLADYVITGPADQAFARLCQRLLNGEKSIEKIIAAEHPPLAALTLPYRCYTEEDIAQRLIYVEASRGCPFRCEFCLSALDKTAWPFDLDRFLDEMDILHQRGVRHFKFVDRTFNLKVDASLRILDFFLTRLDEHLFLHFELIPDQLPERLKAAIQRFPAGTLQFEIGIQSFNPAVQALVSRKQDNAKTERNLRWLRSQTQAHLHTDLIVGLPGEDLASLAAGFNRLVALDPHEIQVGMLKRLRGAPIDRHSESHGIKYNPAPPCNMLCSNWLDFATVQRLNRFARYWDLIGNAGRFPQTKPILLGDDPFARFLAFSDWLYATTGQTHQFALERLFDCVYQGLTRPLAVAPAVAEEVLSLDYRASGARGRPQFLRHSALPTAQRRQRPEHGTSRQARHARTPA